MKTSTELTERTSAGTGVVDPGIGPPSAPSARQLFIRFLRDYPYLPAVGLFRAVEIRQVLDEPFPTGQGLDLGCGDGILMRVILESVGSREIIGIDPDKAEVELAAQLGVYARVLPVPGQSVPLPDASLDWVFSNSVLEHIDDIDGVLREVSRLLRPDGVFFFTVPADRFHGSLRGPLLPWADRQAYLDYLDRRVIHRRYWSQDDWRAHLDPHGFHIERAIPYMTPPQLRRWESIGRLTSTVAYALFGHRRAPVEVQRSLGLRRGHRRVPGFLVGALARVLSFGVSLDAQVGPGEVGTCLMVFARKRGGAQAETATAAG